MYYVCTVQYRVVHCTLMYSTCMDIHRHSVSLCIPSSPPPPPPPQDLFDPLPLSTVSSSPPPPPPPPLRESPRYLQHSTYRSQVRFSSLFPSPRRATVGPTTDLGSRHLLLHSPVLYVLTYIPCRTPRGDPISSACERYVQTCLYSMYCMYCIVVCL